MAILAEWKNTLEMFKPKSLKLLSLATLNAFKQACSTIFYNIGWWLLALGILFILSVIFAWLVMHTISLWFYSSPQTTFSRAVYLYVSGGFERLEYYISVFLFCVTIRPSVERKTGRYFVSFMKQFLYLLPLLWFCSATGHLIGSRLLHLFWAVPTGLLYIFWPTGYKYAVYVSIPVYICLIWTMPTIFFALDSNGSFRRVMRAYWQGDKMILYTLPAYLIVALFYVVIVWLLSWAITSLPEGFHEFWAGHDLIQYILNCVLVPFFVCIMSVIYTKKVHDNSELYN
jgi:hypothetical protein